MRMFPSREELPRSQQRWIFLTSQWYLRDFPTTNRARRTDGRKGTHKKIYKHLTISNDFPAQSLVCRIFGEQSRTRKTIESIRLSLSSGMRYYSRLHNPRVIEDRKHVCKRARGITQTKRPCQIWRAVRHLHCPRLIHLTIKTCRGKGVMVVWCLSFKDFPLRAGGGLVFPIEIATVWE